MKTIRIIEAMDYPVDSSDALPEHYLLLCEIAARVQELDELLPSTGKAPGGIRVINRLGAVERRSRRAYRLLLDMLSQQESFSESFETLGARRDHSRQSWLQNAQADIELIKEVWPEVGTVMAELIKRRTADDAGVV
jgi:hypothetical protein